MKIGDTVICNDATGKKALSKGKSYEVSGVDAAASTIELKSVKGSWFKMTRFSLSVSISSSSSTTSQKPTGALAPNPLFATNGSGARSPSWRSSDLDKKIHKAIDAAKSMVPRAETPCRTCKRNNDIGVKTCWCCGNHP